MTYKYFFFDFDGMLADTYAHTTTAFVKAINSLRKEKITYKEAYDYLKISFGDCFNHFKVSKEEIELFDYYHRDIYFKPVATLYLPIKKILESIIKSGGKNFIYTNRDEQTYDYLKMFGIYDLFEDFIINAHKPSKEPLEEMILKHHLNKNECVVVGDRALDVDGAYNASMDGILYDVDSRVFFHHGTYVIKHLNELYNFIDLPYTLKNNYHTHTIRCGHATGSDEEYVIEAIKAGYQTLGFTDHVMIPDTSKDYEYFDDIYLLKEKYKDQIDIKIGLEVEYFPRYMPFYKKLLDEKSVDYLIFGNHSYLSPDRKSRSEENYCFITKFEDESYLDIYYDCLLKAVESKMFKYICHPDCFMKGWRKWDDKAIALTHKIAKLLEENNLYAELSGSGIRASTKMEYNGEMVSCYPFKEFFKILSQYNIKFVLGCDAHAPTQLDDKAVQTLCDMAKELNLNVVYELNDL